MHTYFAVFPMHPLNSKTPNVGDLKVQMSQFKRFLETKGSELSKTSEFLPFYALPYV